jgi:hypothetical protein
VEAKGSVTPFTEATILQVRLSTTSARTGPRVAGLIANVLTAAGCGKTMFELHTVPTLVAAVTPESSQRAASSHWS